MTRIDVTKKIAKYIIGTSVGFATANVIANNVSPQKAHQKVEAVIGGMVIGAMVAERAEQWSDEKIDTIVAWWDANVKK